MAEVATTSTTIPARPTNQPTPLPETSAAREAISVHRRPLTPDTVDAKIVSAGFDPIPVAANAQAIRREMNAHGKPIVVDGVVAAADGKFERSWTSVESVDSKTGGFVVRPAGASASTEITRQQLDAFVSAKLGGDAIEIDPRPAGAASQREIDAIVAAAPQAQQVYARESVPLLLDAAVRAGITNQNQVAYILATAQREVRFGATLIEGGNGKSIDGIDHYFDRYEPGTKQGDVLGNSEAGDGERFKGRGFVQITGRSHAATFSEKLGMPDIVADGKKVPYFVANPQKLARPDIAAQTMVIGMRDGTFSGRSLDRYIDGKKTDYAGARHIVNGVDHAAEIAHDAERYQRAIEGKSLGRGDESHDAKHAVEPGSGRHPRARR